MLKKLNHFSIIFLGTIWLLGAAVNPVLACGSGGDSGSTGCASLVSYCYDNDGDGAGNPDLSIVQCIEEPPVMGFVFNCSDSDDTNINIQ